MRFRSLTCLLLGAAGVVVAGCGPLGPSSLEGFGDVGDGDGDTGDVDTEDTDTGDGDGDGDCIDVNFGSPPEIFFDGELTPDLDNDFEGFCAPSPAGDYAIEWTAPFSGNYFASLFTEFGGSLTILAGDCDGEPLFCDAFVTPIDTSFFASAGQTYTFVIDGEVGGYYSFALYPGDVMSTCPDGFLFGFNDTQFGSTFGGGYTFTSPCGGEGSPERTYLFSPEQDGPYQIDTFGSNFDTVLYVLEGECAGPELVCNDDALDSLSSLVNVDLKAGQVYTVVVDGLAGTAGDYQLNLQFGDDPQDLCDEVEIAPPGVPVVMSWPVDASFSNLYHECSFASAERRILWTAPADGLYHLEQSAGPNFSAVALALDGCNAFDTGCLIPVGETVEAEFEAFAGQQILIISEWEPFEPGEITLSIDLAGGDGFCGEDLGNVAPFMHAGTTVGESDDHEGSCASNPAPDDELHWTAPQTGTYEFKLDGSSYDTLMYIRDGDCDGPELGCNDDTVTPFGLELWSTIELDLVAGQLISIFVDGYDSGGDYVLTITQI